GERPPLDVPVQGDRLVLHRRRQQGHRVVLPRAAAGRRADQGSRLVLERAHRDHRRVAASLETRWPSPTATSARSATSSSCSRTTFDPTALSERLAALEKEMGEPGFWDDQDRAAKVSAEHSRTQRKLDAYRRLESDVDDLEALEELAAEDPSMADELREQYASVAERLADLELERLFSGPYDAGDAVVTVNSGAGGTDSQDWAEMLLRMLLRFAEKHGFQVEMVEASPGEEAGIKSATF